MKKLFSEDEKLAYFANEDGKIWSHHKTTGRWFELKLRKLPDGYLQFDRCQNGKRKSIRVHRAVWEAFNGPIPEGYEINHINTVRDDNRLENLELVTPSGNQLHPPTREHHHEAARRHMKPVMDLTTGVVYESTKEAARQTGLNQGNISSCCNGRYSQTGGREFRFADTLPESKLILDEDYVNTQISNFIDLYAEELSGK